MQQVRGYAKAAGGKKVAQAAKPAVEAAAVPGPDDLSPPAFKIKHVPRVYKGDPVAQLTPAQVRVQHMHMHTPWPTVLISGTAA